MVLSRSTSFKLATLLAIGTALGHIQIGAQEIKPNLRKDAPSQLAIAGWLQGTWAYVLSAGSYYRLASLAVFDRNDKLILWLQALFHLYTLGLIQVPAAKCSSMGFLLLIARGTTTV